MNQNLAETELVWRKTLSRRLGLQPGLSKEPQKGSRCRISRSGALSVDGQRSRGRPRQTAGQIMLSHDLMRAHADLAWLSGLPAARRAPFHKHPRTCPTLASPRHPHLAPPDSLASAAGERKPRSGLIPHKYTRHRSLYPLPVSLCVQQFLTLCRLIHLP